MKERPILFSGNMVRTLLAGTKLQTRRLLRPKHLSGSGWHVPNAGATSDTMTTVLARFCPYGQPGDRLWVRETWRVETSGEVQTLYYRADEPWHDGAGWSPSIHMPRWASRLTLEVTAVRVQRACEISEEDALAEGVLHGNDLGRTVYTDTGARVSARDAFRALLGSIYGPDAWEKWFWAVSFKVAR
jgi:hypothetical protein